MVPGVPIYAQIPKERYATERLLKAPWKGFYGQRVSYVNEGTVEEQ